MNSQMVRWWWATRLAFDTMKMFIISQHMHSVTWQLYTVCSCFYLAQVILHRVPGRGVVVKCNIFILMSCMHVPLECFQRNSGCFYAVKADFWHFTSESIVCLYTVERLTTKTLTDHASSSTLYFLKYLLWTACSDPDWPNVGFPL